MTKRLIPLAGRMYTLLLRAYPSEWRQKFSEEMHLVFSEALLAAAEQGALEPFLLRELRDAPQALAGAYWYRWTKKWHWGIRLISVATSSSDLPPPPPDGRESWRQVGLELSLFLLAGLLLLLVTYLPPEGVRPGWQRDLDYLGRVIAPLTVPFLMVGLARGLPRWAYPFGGLLLAHQALAVYQNRLWPFLILMLLASVILALGTLVTNPQPSPLPVPVRRIGQSLSLDWTRLSFGIYGAVPLGIIMAFDDGYANNRTLLLALAVLALVAGALIYCRSRRTITQIAALFVGMSLSIWAAWLDKIALAGSMGHWIRAPYPGSAESAWMMSLWITWNFLILSPALLAGLGRVARTKRVL
jgi:hypothetical protein